MASAGSGISAASVQAWRPVWSWSTPPVLMGGWLATADVWGGMLAGTIPISHPRFASFAYSYCSDGSFHIRSLTSLSPFLPRSAPLLFYHYAKRTRLDTSRSKIGGDAGARSGVRLESVRVTLG